MHFCIIIPTLNRHDQLLKCLQSIQSAINGIQHLIIIIDQNDNDNFHAIPSELFKLLKIVHHRSDIKGLSHNRNLALEFVPKESYVIFMDDDNIVHESFFEKIKQFHKIQCNLIYIVSGLNMTLGTQYTPKKVSKNENYTVRDYKSFISWNFIIHNKIIQKIGDFDTLFGVGSQYGACEETDFIVRAFSFVQEVPYISEAVIYHPDNVKDYTNLDRLKSYSLGFGAFYAKRLLSKKLTIFWLRQFILLILRNIFALTLNLFEPNKRPYYISALKYKLIGFYHYIKTQKYGN